MTGRLRVPPHPDDWTSVDYAWAAAIAMPLLVCAPFLLCPPLWIGALMTPTDGAPTPIAGPPETG
jgi:hypothetical protein